MTVFHKLSANSNQRSIEQRVGYAHNTQLAENAARKIVPIFEECGVRHFGNCEAYHKHRCDKK
jgi:hypothetical protein